ncbi:MAG: hypothetical protein AVDCRST_MAG11-2957, partial [uncultured Gemmatimonadaceae bacterium]
CRCSVRPPHPARIPARPPARCSCSSPLRPRSSRRSPPPATAPRAPTACARSRR